MTVAQFVRTAVRLWYVVLLGAVLTLVAAHGVQQTSGAYWSKVSLNLLPSRIESNGGNELLSKGPTALAAAVVSSVNQGPATLRAASTDANLVGMGERSATLIQLRNGGGQWLPRAAGPYIDIEAVDATPEEVEARIEAATAKVRASIRSFQDELDVPTGLRVIVTQSPEQVRVDFIHTSPTRALAAVLLAGAGATLAGVLVVDRLLGAPRRRRRRGERPAEKVRETAPVG